MRKINFLNRKGGVGKTSMCANLAYELARAAATRIAPKPVTIKK